MVRSREVEEEMALKPKPCTWPLDPLLRGALCPMDGGLSRAAGESKGVRVLRLSYGVGVQKSGRVTLIADYSRLDNYFVAVVRVLAAHCRLIDHIKTTGYGKQEAGVTSWA